jgi:hypothetical protein
VVPFGSFANDGRLVAHRRDRTVRPVRPVSLVYTVYVKQQAHNLSLRVASHGVQLYILSPAYLHSRLYIGPVFHPRTFCRCSQIPILGHRTLIQSCRPRPSRVATYSSFCTPT